MDTEHSEEVLNELHNRFERTWRELGASRVPDFAAVAARYQEPHRAYHTLEHIQECLRWLDAVQAQADRPFEVELALVYHDVIYEPRRTDNERRSADFFRNHATVAGLTAERRERICALIEGTVSHSTGCGDGALLNDIDLAVLGASPGQFDRYEAQVRREYAHVGDMSFCVGRKHVLNSFLETCSVYATPFFERRLEAQARGNLSRALTKTSEVEAAMVRESESVKRAE